MLFVIAGESLITVIPNSIGNPENAEMDLNGLWIPHQVRDDASYSCRV